MTQLCIRHAIILTPRRRINDGTLLTDGDLIVAVGETGRVNCPPAARVIDANGLFLSPGFIDLQLNGGFGHDFTADPSSIWTVAADLPRYGITSFLPTIVTAPPETITTALSILAQGPPAEWKGASPLGLHLEGPFLNPVKRGAHDPAYLRTPSSEEMTVWTPERGVRMVTLAPELPDALRIITTLATRGVVVSAGHSAATYEQAQAGLRAGISYGTHIFNAMPPLRHREPGLVGALLDDEQTTVGLIADGTHIHPAVVRLIWRSTGADRLTLVTDAIAGLGMPSGRYRLGEREVLVDTDAGTARLPDGTLAGSILTPDTALRNLITFTGCSLTAALTTITHTPARLLGLLHRIGTLRPGRRADLVLLTSDLHVVKTVVGGRPDDRTTWFESPYGDHAGPQYRTP